MACPPPPTEHVSAWVNLLQAHGVIGAALEARLESEAGLSLAEHEVLLRLAGADGGRLKMLQLADLLLVSRSGATRLIDRMSEAGWVTREACAGDRRVIYAVISPAGRELVTRAGPLFSEAVGEVFSAHLGDDDVAELRRILRKLLEGNGRWSDARCTLADAELLGTTP